MNIRRYEGSFLGILDYFPSVGVYGFTRRDDEGRWLAVIDPETAAKLHEEASSGLLQATAEYEAAVMSGEATERARATERYTAAREEYSASLDQLLKTRRQHSRTFLSALADPSVGCDARSMVLASIVAYAAALPASAGLEVRRAAGHLYLASDNPAAGVRHYSDVGQSSADRRYGFPLTAAR